MDAGSGWTEERVQLLARLWSEGLSASQIATALGNGVTRNAVIGKVHRLGLAARAKTAPQAASRPAAAAPKPKAPSAAPVQAQPSASSGKVVDFSSATPASPAAAALPAATGRDGGEVAIPITDRVTILDLRESMCRWPLGDPTTPDFGFCGARTVSGLPYCAAHCRVAYQPVTDRRRMRAF